MTDARDPGGERIASQELDQATAQLLMELAFLVPRGTSMQPESPLGSRLVAFRDAVWNAALSAAPAVPSSVRELIAKWRKHAELINPHRDVRRDGTSEAFIRCADELSALVGHEPAPQEQGELSYREVWALLRVLTTPGQRETWGVSEDRGMILNLTRVIHNLQEQQAAPAVPSSPPQEMGPKRAAALSLVAISDVEAAWDLWRASLPVGAFTHTDGAAFIAAIYALPVAAPSSPAPQCDCGSPLTQCASCAVSEYQGDHPECRTCCPIGPSSPAPPQWEPIATAPKGEIILFFPADDKHRLAEMVKVDSYPVHYPRQPTHWMPLPEPPQ